MDDLNMIHTVLTEDHESEATHQAEARLRLQQMIRSDRSGTGAVRTGRRSAWQTLRWSVMGTGLVAAAAAATLVVGLGGTATTPQPAPPGVAGSVPGTGTEPVSAQQFLLAAAMETAKEPATTGKYWRVRWLMEVPAMRQLPSPPPSPSDKTGSVWRLVDHWVAAKGTSWAGQLTYQNGKALSEPRLEEFFSGWGAEAEFGLAEVNRLPADPATLRVKLTEKARELGVDINLLTADGVEGYIFEATVGLLARAPLSPAQRSAAYRLLATLTGVEATGTATDSQGRTGMSISHEGSAETNKLIIDQDTYVILAITTRQKPAVANRWAPSREMLITIREWTDQEPTLPTLP